MREQRSPCVGFDLFRITRCLVVPRKANNVNVPRFFFIIYTLSGADRVIHSFFMESSNKKTTKRNGIIITILIFLSISIYGIRESYKTSPHQEFIKKVLEDQQKWEQEAEASKELYERLRIADTSKKIMFHKTKKATKMDFNKAFDEAVKGKK